ncbi:unnamed protein product [Brachionus calyciflorus]|uniref:Uncharacterized protein n=1 Tax=Brachionus calyciflorus TaxID=104777 RepID=A0A813XB63_9BILA|nr:unnamed protein product [Brachionus calyciflorus]
MISSLMARKPINLGEALKYAEILEADLGARKKENLLSMEEFEPNSKRVKIASDVYLDMEKPGEDGYGFNFHNLMRKNHRSHIRSLNENDYDFLNLIDDMKEEKKAVAEKHTDGSGNTSRLPEGVNLSESALDEVQKARLICLVKR